MYSWRFTRNKKLGIFLNLSCWRNSTRYGCWDRWQHCHGTDCHPCIQVSIITTFNRLLFTRKIYNMFVSTIESLKALKRKLGRIQTNTFEYLFFEFLTIYSKHRILSNTYLHNIRNPYSNSNIFECQKRIWPNYFNNIFRQK
jgi:hypothetical protein